MKRNFYVKFRHGPAGTEEGKVLSSHSARDAAREIREQYKGVKIDAIVAVGRGAGNAVGRPT